MLWLIAKLVPWELVGIGAVVIVGASLLGVDLVTPMVDFVVQLVADLLGGIEDWLTQQVADSLWPDWGSLF